MILLAQFGLDLLSLFSELTRNRKIIVCEKSSFRNAVLICREFYGVGFSCNAGLSDASRLNSLAESADWMSDTFSIRFKVLFGRLSIENFESFDIANFLPRKK